MILPQNRFLMLIIACSIGLAVSSSRVLSQSVEDVSFSGQVIDASGKPMAGVEVTFAAPSRHMWIHSPALIAIERAETPRQSSSTNAQGNYQIRLPTANPHWLSPGDGLVLIRGGDGKYTVTKYKLARGLVDQPLDFRMPDSGQGKIRIVDAQNKPVIGVDVSPARIAKALLPFDVAQRLKAKTNADGVVEFPTNAAELEAVYVTGKDVGNQFLLVRKVAGGVGTAIVRDARPRQLKCKWLDDSEIKAIPTIQWTVLTLNDSEDKAEFAWQRVESSGAEVAMVANLPTGFLSCRSDASSGHGLFAEYNSDSLADDQKEMVVKLKRGLHVTGRVVSLEDGQPIAGVTLQSSQADQHIISDAQGNYAVWLPKVSDGCYPIDPFQEHFNSAAFYASPEAESAQGEATIKPFELNRSTTAMGTVVDAQGHPVAGATVRCEYQQERFVMTNNFLSDRHGMFRIRGIGDGTPVKLSVLDRQGVTEQPVELTLSSAEPLTIRLSAPQVKQFVGRIVDRSLKPISGAYVSLKRGQVMIPAGYNPAEYNLVDAFSNEETAGSPSAPSQIVTDASGRFRSNDCIDWRGMFGLTVQHADYYDRTTWLRDVSKTSPDIQQFDFGDIVLDHLPGPQTISIKVTDKDGQPLPEASVLLIQGRDFAGTAATNSEGEVRFSAKHTKGLIAVSHKLGTTFEVNSFGQSAVHVTVDSQKCRQPWSISEPDLARRRAIAAKLLEKFELAKSLEFDSASEGEIIRVMAAKAFADPASIDRMLVTKLPALAKRGDIALMIGQSVLSRDSQLISKYGSIVPLNYRAWFYVDAANKADSASDREALLAEAIQSARQSTGDEAATDVGRIAMLLLQSNEIESATELVSELFESHRDELTANTSQRTKRGVARYFFPQLALVDFDLACKLIHQNAYPNEIERLQTLALAIAVSAKKIDWETGLKSVSRNAFVASEASLIPGTFGETPLPSAEFSQALSSRIVNRRLRGIAQLLAASTVPEASQLERQRWLSEGVQSLVTCGESAPTMEHELLATHIHTHIKRLAKVDPLAARRVAFECLRELSPLQDGQYYYLAQRHAAVAKLLAGLDVELGLALVEPFLSDLGWHYRAGARYSIAPLSVAASIDPSYALSIAEKLIEGEYKEDRLRQAFALNDLVDGLVK